MQSAPRSPEANLADPGLVDLEEDVFANTPNLSRLELQGNKIILKPHLFRYTPKLKLLDLSENMLDRIPEMIFETLDKLELLHLWNNKLTAINDFTFQGLTNLKYLELSSNEIETISDGAFKSLVNLEKINLTKNKLTSVSSDIFSHNTKLEVVLFKYNENLRLPDHLFSNLPALKEIYFENCSLDSIPENIFENSPKIEKVYLERNKFKQLPEKLFENLDNLKEIRLNHNKIEIIGKIFSSLKKLKSLKLQGNEITEIKFIEFKDLDALEEINLRNNKISKIDQRVFHNMNNLKTIDLSHNQIAELNSKQFTLLENVPNVETINLSHNKIVQIEHIITLYNKVHLRVLDLSYNRITNITLKDLQPIGNQLTINLENNLITTVDFTLVNAITADVKDAYHNHDQSQSLIFLGNNPIDCDCYNYDLVKYFQNDLKPQIKVMFNIKAEDLKCSNPPELRDLPVHSVPQQLLICSFERIGEDRACPENCSCNYRPFDDSLILDYSYRNLTEFPDIEPSQTISSVRFNQTELHLEGNLLNEGLDTNCTGYENVTRLYLSHNKIGDVAWLPPKLEVLHLDNNNISYLSYNVLDALNRSLVNLTLNQNPWKCNCEAQNLTNFLRQRTKVVDAKEIRCFNSSTLLINLNQNDLCHRFQPLIPILVILGILLLAATVTITYFYFQQPIKIYLYSHNLCLWWVTEEELDKDKLYDAFISYSHKDEDFVVQNLLPVLEGGPNPYKLCLHYRNWIPGEYIATQVTNSVLDSRRTLVVLSPNFLESVWGKMEFRTAHTQAMTEGRARVIIVLYGDVDMNKLDDELKTYLKTNTYVKWGDPYFWRKLKYALPHSKGNGPKNNQKIANVMSVIDDKFNLVTPASPSPSTTPPVLSIDPNVLRKHPLNFVPSTDLDTPPAESGTLLVSTCL